MKLNISIKKIKCIEDLTLELPIDKGLYAITGQNGSGKSTIVACASGVFYYNMPLQQYFGKMDNDASISFELGDSKRSLIKGQNNRWNWKSEGPHMNINGFYEGSLIFGNRFKDMNYDNIRSLDSIDQNKLIPADEFVRKYLGHILQGDENYYEKLWLVSPNYERFKGNIFYYEKNGKRISQFHMSTGENLLISILNSLYHRNNNRGNILRACVIFLDEIELALHPSSLKRLVHFLREMADQFNYAIYFSTHSIELISGIKPSNIFYIERHPDNTIEVVNPCYPAYATRTLYDHCGYDKVILVEDDLAKAIVERLLRHERLLNNKLVHILPCGGYTNVIDLADDVVTHNLFGNKTSIAIVLDGDIKDKAQLYRTKKNIKNNVALNFLPIESLEKYIRNKLFINVDHTLFRRLDNYIFQKKSLKELVDLYRTSADTDNDNDGKKLFKIIDAELRERKFERSEMVSMLVDYLFETNDESLKRLTTFLQKQMES